MVFENVNENLNSITNTKLIPKKTNPTKPPIIKYLKNCKLLNLSKLNFIFNILFQLTKVMMFNKII